LQLLKLVAIAIASSLYFSFYGELTSKTRVYLGKVKVTLAVWVSNHSVYCRETLESAGD